MLGMSTFNKRIWALHKILADAGYPSVAAAAQGYPSNVEHFSRGRESDEMTQKRVERADTQIEAELTALCKALGLSLNALKGVRR